MNYTIPLNPFGFNPENSNNKVIEEELFQIKRTLSILEERIKILEEKNLKKSIPKYMNSEINKSDGFYIL